LIKDALKRDRKVGHHHMTWHDMGTFSPERVDYPIFTLPVVEAILDKEVKGGVLICGSGVGMSIAANRFPGIYAALCWSPEVARAAKEDDNANIIVIPADFVTEAQAHAIIDAWLSYEFKEHEYKERLELLEKLAQRK